MSAERPVVRTAGLVMILILVSRVLGFVRERAIAEVFGATWQTDALRLAFNIPDLMFAILVAGGLNAAFIPTFTGYLAREEEDEGWRMAWTFFTLGLIVLVLMTILGIIFSPALSYIVAIAYTGEKRQVLVSLMQVLFPAVFFTALAGLGMGVHKSYKSFNAPLWGPVVYNLFIIGGAYLLGRRYGIMGIAAGTVAGAMGNFLLQMPFFIRKAKPHRFKFNLRHPGISRALYLMGPAVLSSSITQLNFTISSSLASSLPESSVSALRVTNTLVQLPLGVFGMGVSMVILPTLSGLMAQGKTDAFRRTFSQGVRLVLFFTIPAAVGLAVLRVPLVRLLFQVGEFSASDTLMAAWAVLYFAPGLISQSAIQVLVQVYYSLQDTKTLVRVSVQSIIINILLSLVFLRFTHLAHGGLALAYSITSVINMLTYLHGLRRHMGDIDAPRIGRSMLLAMLASLLMGVVVWAAATGSTALISPAHTIGRLVEVGAGVGAGALAYLAFIFLLRMEETTFLRQALQRRSRSTGDTE